MVEHIGQQKDKLKSPENTYFTPFTVFYTFTEVAFLVSL